MKIIQSCNTYNRRIRKGSVRFRIISARLYTCSGNLATWKIRFQSFNILSRKNWKIFFRFQLFKFCNISLNNISLENSSINQQKRKKVQIPWHLLTKVNDSTKRLMETCLSKYSGYDSR